MMKFHLTWFLIFTTMLVAGTASGGDAVPATPDAGLPTVKIAAGDTPTPSKTSAKKAADALDEEYRDEENLNDDKFEEERVTIADPIEPFNRAMYHVNDKLYFWLIKPAARGYKTVVPEPARISVKNFFSNIQYPARLVSCLLQADFGGAATETGRFVINTLWGLGGILDPSAGPELNLQIQDTDLGQTLGVYGVGHGFYIVWPFFGPSSPRDSMTVLVDQLVLYPPTYVDPFYASFGIRAYEVVNSASLRIGEYESLKGAAIDPYISMRDAYIQYRLKAVKARRARSLWFKTAVTDTAGTPVPAGK